MDRNTVLAIVLSLAILLGWQMLFPPKHPPPQTAPVAKAEPAAGPSLAGAVSPPNGVPSPSGSGEAAAAEQRLRIDTAAFHGSIALDGLKFDALTLAQYHETPNPKSAEIVLLSPPGTSQGTYAEQGWLAADETVKTPGPGTVWTPEKPDAVLTEATPVVLTWENGEGLRFVRTIHVDDKFMFTIDQTVENNGAKPVTLYPYALVARFDTPKAASTLYLHVGPIGVIDGTLKEVTYKDLKDKPAKTADSTGGWIGITDKYFLTAVAFDQGMKVKTSFNYALNGDRDHYQTDLRGDAVTLPPGGSESVKSYVFAGAKDYQVLQGYEQNLHLPLFDRAIDFGSYLWVLTIPFFHALLWLKNALGNFALAILAFTFLLRSVMFPVANRQYSSMAKMKALQPEMKRLQERYKEDRPKLNQELMELYKREKVNPVGGCLPILVQLPIFIALYKVLYVSIEMRQAPFYGWIHDLSAPDPTSVLNLFGLLPYHIPQFLAFASIGAWPLIYGVSMWMQQRLQPAAPDPMQARMMSLMPIFLTFVLASVPAGLVIYWTWSNTLGILQQWVLTRRSRSRAAKA